MVEQDLRGTHSNDIRQLFVRVRGDHNGHTAFPPASLFVQRGMACSNHLLGHRIIQNAGLLTLLYKHQVLNVALRALDGAEIQPAYFEPVGGCVAHGIVQHFAVGSRA